MKKELQEKYGDRLELFQGNRSHDHIFKNSLFFRIDGEYIGYVDWNDDRGIMGMPYIEVWTHSMQEDFYTDPIRFTDIDKFVEWHNEYKKGEQDEKR